MSIPTNILDDLSTRFIINIPQEERNDLIRICFQIELAHWHYLDFICQTQTSLPKHNFRNFVATLFTHIPFLNQYSVILDEVIAKWKLYKQSVPTCGAILLDGRLRQVLLVQGFGAKSWGFPKGKINEKELPVTCAAREVKEETGYDCSDRMSDDCYLERRLRETSVRLYIVKDVDTDFAFKPLARNEIKEIKWFDISELPVQTHDGAGTAIPNANQFYTVCPFVKPLHKWIVKEKQKDRIERKGLLRAKEGQTDRFWVKSWDNIKFDWEDVWKDITKELKISSF